MAQVKDAQGNVEEAKNDLIRSIEIYPYLDNLFFYGNFLFSYGMYEEAVNTYMRIIGTNSDKQVKKTLLNYRTFHILNRVYINLATILKVYKRYKESSECLNKALSFQKYLIQKNPKEIDFHINTLSMQGNLLSDMHNYEKASYYFEKAIELCEIIYDGNSRGLAASYSNIGINYHRLGNQKESEKFLSKALIILENNSKTDESVHSDLARLYSWLYRIRNDKLYAFKAHKEYSILFELNKAKYQYDKIVSLVDYTGCLDDFVEIENNYDYIIGQKESLLKIDVNLYSSLIGSTCRLFAIALIENNKLDKALKIINIGLKELKNCYLTYKTNIEELILIINLKIDILLENKEKSSFVLKSEVIFFEKLMSDKRRIIVNKDFEDVFNARLKLYLNHIKNN
jgi:tetratricopeptide (TPR) repeat protein